MKPKKDPERLSLLLGDVDPALLEEAYLTDTPEKLAKLQMKSRPLRRRRTVLPRVAVATISFVLALSMLLGVFVLLRPDTPGVETPEDTHGTSDPDDPSVDPSEDAPWKTGKLTLTSLTYAAQSSSLSTGRISFDLLSDTEPVTDALPDAETSADTEAGTLPTPDAPVFGQGENVQVSMMDSTKISEYMGPDLIKTRPTEGEHTSCSDVYYHIRTGETVCMSCRVLSVIQGSDLYTDAAIESFREDVLLNDTNLWASGAVEEWRETYTKILSNDKSRELFAQLKKPTLAKLGIETFAFDDHEARVKEHIKDYQYPVVDVAEYGYDPNKCLFSLVSPLTGYICGSYLIDLTTGDVIRIDQTLINPMTYGDDIKPNFSLAEKITVLGNYEYILVTLPYLAEYYQTLFKDYLMPVYGTTSVLFFKVSTGEYRHISYADSMLYTPSAAAEVYGNVIYFPSGEAWYFYTDGKTLYSVEGDLVRVITSKTGVSYAVMQEADGYAFYPITGESATLTATTVQAEDFDTANRYTVKDGVRIDVLTGETFTLWRDILPAATATSRDGRYIYLYFEGAPYIQCVDVYNGELGWLRLSETFVTQAAEAAATGSVTYGLFLNAQEDALLMTYCKEGVVVFDAAGYSDHNHMHDAIGDILNFYTVNGQKLNFISSGNALRLLELFYAQKQLDRLTEKYTTGTTSGTSLYPQIAEQLIPYLDVWGNNAEVPSQTLYQMLGDVTLSELEELTHTNPMSEMLRYYYEDHRITTTYGYERERVLDYMARDVGKAMAEFFCVTPTDEQMTALKALLLPKLDALLDEKFYTSTAEMDILFAECFGEVCPLLTGMSYDAFIKNAGFLAWEYKYTNVQLDTDIFITDMSPYCAKTDALGDVRLSLQKKLDNTFITEFLSNLTFEAGTVEITPITSLFRKYSDVAGLPYCVFSFLDVGYDKNGNAYVVIDGYYASITAEEAETFKRTHVQAEQRYLIRDWCWY